MASEPPPIEPTALLTTEELGPDIGSSKSSSRAPTELVSPGPSPAASSIASSEEDVEPKAFAYVVTDSDEGDHAIDEAVNELVLETVPGEGDKAEVGKALEDVVRSPRAATLSPLQPPEAHEAEVMQLVEKVADEASDDRDDEDEEEEEEEEPVLKYAKLTPILATLLSKDSASAITASSQIIAIGTHAGMVYVLSHKGIKLNEYRAHSASVMAIEISDDGSEFIGTCSIDGKVVINSLLSTERYIHSFARPVRALALQPGFAKSSSKAFVCGGLSGSLSLMEKGWHLGGLGGLVGGGGHGKHSEKVLAEGEGPIWNVKWERGGLIAWANDLGVKLYDTQSQRLLSFIDRPAEAPRADLLKPSLTFITPPANVSPVHEPTQLIVSWADTIKLVRIRTRTSIATSRPSSLHGAVLPPGSGSTQTAGASHTTLHVEITAILQLDAPIAGLVPYKDAFLIFAYLAPEEKEGSETFYDDDGADATEEQEPSRPELRIVSRRGEELSSDALGLEGWPKWRCSDYGLIALPLSQPSAFVVLSPKEIVIARERDSQDRVEWLVERRRYEEALDLVERLGKEGLGEGEMTVRGIGEKFLDSLVRGGEYEKAASLLAKVLGQDKRAWEDWIFLFAQKQQLEAIIPFVPTAEPQLGHMVYELVLAYLLQSNRPALLGAIKTWSPQIYKVSSVVNAIEGVLSEEPGEKILMECLAELFLLNHQPAKALPYFLRLRRPDVFNLIRQHNLFAAVQDQVLLLVEFDVELDHSPEKAVDTTERQVLSPGGKHGKAIELLVDHVHSIPIDRVTKQLAAQPKYLYMYLDCLFSHDPHIVSAYGDQHIALCAEFDHPRLMELLRIGGDYSLEKAFLVCKQHDFVPEMVFLLGRMGNAKEALMLIINRLGDVQQAIEFAREQDDEDLWEDLLRYSEDKPLFIRALLENVGADIDPMLLIRRIRNGMEIPGLKDALIKILQDFSLQISLLEGCQKILDSDCNEYLVQLHRGATHGLFGPASATPQTLRTVIPS